MHAVYVIVTQVSSEVNTQFLPNLRGNTEIVRGRKYDTKYCGLVLEKIFKIIAVYGRTDAAAGVEIDL